MAMTPDEVSNAQKLGLIAIFHSDILSPEEKLVLKSAIALIQDYQKLRESKEVFSFQVSKEGELLNEEDVLWLSFKDGMINLNALADSKPGIVGKRLREAIVTYLQQRIKQKGE